VEYKITFLIDKRTPVKSTITTLIDKTTPVKYKITILIDKTTPVKYQNKHTIQCINASKLYHWFLNTAPLIKNK
jgi:hypothetical protein